MWQELIDRIWEIDPAADSRWEIALCYPGLHALWFHSVAHKLWLNGLKLPARFISNIGRTLTGIEIHPGAQIGRRVFIDHGMGVVIGETAIVGDDVVLYQGVTLGTGIAGRQGDLTRHKKRHPTLGRNVVVGNGASIQGNIHIGDNCRIASGSIVLEDIPADSVVAGVPGRIVSMNGQRVEDNGNKDKSKVQPQLEDLFARLEKLEGQFKNSCLNQIAAEEKQCL